MSEFNVREYGAAGDGITNDTRYIQAAIDACNLNGGKVVFPAGTYRIGTIIVKSDVHLHITAGAVIQGSHDFQDYSDNIERFVDGVGKQRGACLVYIGEATNVTIDGEGTIDGQGFVFHKDRGYSGERPFLLRALRSNRLKIQGITLRDSAAWVAHFQECEDVNISGMTIRSRVNFNNDGLDIDGCSRVRIQDCDINTHDDAICLKTTGTTACEQIEIHNCKLSSHHAAIKFGTESRGDFRQVHIANCHLYDTDGCGIKLTAVDGGTIEDILFTDITMDNVTGPIFLRLGSRLKTFRAGDLPGTIGSFRNVIFRNIRANVKEGVTRSEAVHLAGIPGHEIQNVTFEGIDLLYPGGVREDLPSYKDMPEHEAAYPEYYIYGVLPAYGFLIRHASDIRLNQVRVGLRRPDSRPAILAVDVRGMSIRNFHETEDDSFEVS